MRLLIVLAIVLATLPLRLFAADTPVGEDVVMSFVVKMLAEAPLAASLIGAIYLLRPVIKSYLNQQIEQLKLIAAAMHTFGEEIKALRGDVKTLSSRIDGMEGKVEELVEASEAQHA